MKAEEFAVCRPSLGTGYADPEPLTHVNLLRTIEAIYGLPKSGMQQPNALGSGISDDTTAAGAFAPAQ